MKTKIFRISCLLLIGFVFISLSSCHQSEDFDDFGLSSVSEERSYLSIDKDPAKEPLTFEEELILKEAFTRITIIRDNGFASIKQKSGDEINISEPLFEFFTAMVERSNDRNLITRTEPYGGDTNCVAYAIYCIATRYNTLYSLDTIINVINGQWGGDGVPFARVGRMVGSFLYYSTIYDASGYLPQVSGTSANIIIVLCEKENGVWVSDNGHAAVFTMVSDNGYVMYENPGVMYNTNSEDDDQRYGLVPIEKVRRAYLITGAIR